MKQDLLDTLKKSILANRFVDRVRIEMRIDHAEYQSLVRDLGLLRDALADREAIDKELAGTLYDIPQIVRNVYLSFDGERSGLVSEELEDVWTELDDLVRDCFLTR